MKLYDVENRVWVGRYRQHFRATGGVSPFLQQKWIAQLCEAFGQDPIAFQRTRGGGTSGRAWYETRRVSIPVSAGSAYVAHEVAHIFHGAKGHGLGFQEWLVACVSELVSPFHAERLRIALEAEFGHEINPPLPLVACEHGAQR